VISYFKNGKWIEIKVPFQVKKMIEGGTHLYVVDEQKDVYELNDNYSDWTKLPSYKPIGRIIHLPGHFAACAGTLVHVAHNGKIQRYFQNGSWYWFGEGDKCSQPVNAIKVMNTTNNGTFVYALDDQNTMWETRTGDKNCWNKISNLPFTDFFASCLGIFGISEDKLYVLSPEECSWIKLEVPGTNLRLLRGPGSTYAPLLRLTSSKGEELEGSIYWELGASSCQFVCSVPENWAVQVWCVATLGSPEQKCTMTVTENTSPPTTISTVTFSGTGGIMSWTTSSSSTSYMNAWSSIAPSTTTLNLNCSFTWSNGTPTFSNSVVSCLRNSTTGSHYTEVEAVNSRTASSANAVLHVVYYPTANSSIDQSQPCQYPKPITDSKND